MLNNIFPSHLNFLNNRKENIVKKENILNQGKKI